MSETVKTVIFAAVAVVAVLAAVFTYPKQEDYRPPDLLGKPMFADFTNPGTAAELAISKVLRGSRSADGIRSGPQRESGLWTIPSSSNYPADAEAQMRDAATSLIDLQVLGIASERQQGPPDLRRD